MGGCRAAAKLKAATQCRASTNAKQKSRVSQGKRMIAILIPSEGGRHLESGAVGRTVFQLRSSSRPRRGRHQYAICRGLPSNWIRQ